MFPERSVLALAADPIAVSETLTCLMVVASELLAATLSRARLTETAVPRWRHRTAHPRDRRPDEKTRPYGLPRRGNALAPPLRAEPRHGGTWWRRTRAGE